MVLWGRDISVRVGLSPSLRFEASSDSTRFYLLLFTHPTLQIGSCIYMAKLIIYTLGELCEYMFAQFWFLMWSVCKCTFLLSAFVAGLTSPVVGVEMNKQKQQMQWQKQSGAGWRPIVAVRRRTVNLGSDVVVAETITVSGRGSVRIARVWRRVK